MEKDVFVEPLQKRFRVELKDANRAKRNRSYLNASDCCGAKLKQEKFCSVCNEKAAAYNCARKLVKIGKVEHLIDAAALEQATDALESMEDIRLHAFLKVRPAGAEDRFDALVYALPVKKLEGQYAELAAVLRGFVAVGEAVFRGNEFQVIVEVGDDGVVRIRKLVEEEQRYGVLPVELSCVNGEIVALERQLVEKRLVDGYDVTGFRDARAEIEERVIEEFVLNGKVPEVKKEVVQAREQDEVARLKALMGG